MPDAGASPLLEVRIRCKCHRTPTGVAEPAVKDVALSIGRGEILCIIGPSGCGKTTTLRIVLGLDRSFEGEVAPDPETLRIGMVFQEPRLLPWRTVEQNVRLVLPDGERDRNLDDLFAAVGLAPWRSHYPAELSLGLARRAALARALANAPGLLVLDEPFVSLDDQAAAELRDLVAGVSARNRTAVLMVTHNIREAVTMADRLLLLTPRPARILAETVMDRPRAARTPAWIEDQRIMLTAQFPAAVA